MANRKIKTSLKIGKILTQCKNAGLTRIEDIEIFIFVCENINLSVTELVEKIYQPCQLQDRRNYKSFLCRINRLGQDTARLKGLELLDLSRRKRNWDEAGQPPFDIRLTTRGKKLWEKLKEK